MEILNFNGSTPSRKRRSNRALLAAAAILVGVVGSTYAASISINNAPIEYGQGVAQTTACDSSVTVAPSNSFVNSSGAGSFNLSEIDVYDTTTAANAGLAKCANKYLKVSVWGDTSTVSSVTCDVNLGAFTAVTGFSSASIGSTCTGIGTPTLTATGQNFGTGGSTGDGFKIVFASPTLAATGIYKITLESHV